MGIFSENDRVKLTDVEVLTLRHGVMTTGRRTAPIPQLKCSGFFSQCQYSLDEVRCYNTGTDGYDVQWDCKATMDDRLRFGKLDLSCEGYDYPDDPYILKGSCGLTYSIYSQDFLEGYYVLMAIIVIIVLACLVAYLFGGPNAVAHGSTMGPSYYYYPIHTGYGHHYRNSSPRGTRTISGRASTSRR